MYLRNVLQGAQESSILLCLAELGSVVRASHARWPCGTYQLLGMQGLAMGAAWMPGCPRLGCLSRACIFTVDAGLEMRSHTSLLSCGETSHLSFSQGCRDREEEQPLHYGHASLWWCLRVFCLWVELQCIEEGTEERRGGRADLCGEAVSPLEFQFSAVRLQLQCECLHP